MPMVIFVGAVLIYAAAAAQDLRQRRVSNYFCAGIAVLGIARWAVLMELAPAGWALAAASLVFGVSLILFALGLLAGGDAKLISATPLLVGADGTFAFIVLMSVIGGVLAFALVAYAAIRWLYIKVERGAKLNGAQPPAADGAIGVQTNRLTVPSVPYGVAIGLAAAVVLFQIQRM